MSSFLEREHYSFIYKIKTYEPFVVRKLYSNGARDGNRTRILGLGSPCSTTKLHMHTKIISLII